MEGRTTDEHVTCVEIPPASLVRLPLRGTMSLKGAIFDIEWLYA